MSHHLPDASRDDANDDRSNSLPDSEVLIDQIADEFLLAVREGKITEIDAFVSSHPKVIENPTLEEPLRRMLETLRMVHGLGAESFTNETPSKPPVAQDPAWPEIEDNQLLRVAGRGGMGVVYEAMQLTLSRKVALKVLPDVRQNDANAVARFQQEARAAAQLHHTNIVPVFDVGNDGKHCFYAMQFIEGHALDEVIRQLRELRDNQGSESRHGLPNSVLILASLTLRCWSAASRGGRDFNFRNSVEMILAGGHECLQASEASQHGEIDKKSPLGEHGRVPWFACADQ